MNSLEEQLELITIDILKTKLTEEICAIERIPDVNYDQDYYLSHKNAALIIWTEGSSPDSDIEGNELVRARINIQIYAGRTYGENGFWNLAKIIKNTLYTAAPNWAAYPGLVPAGGFEWKGTDLIGNIEGVWSGNTIYEIQNFDVIEEE